MTDEIVTRLYRCVVEQLRERGHSDDEPVKASEIYQELVPYRAVRAALGVELNADYEHALLRLFAGERGLLRLEPETAREELRREVEAPYPFVGIFRKYSANDVWITLPDEEEDAADAAQHRANRPVRTPTPIRPEHVRPDPAAVPVRVIATAAHVPGSDRGRARGGPAPARAPAPVQLHREAESGDDAAAEATLVDGCVFCDGDLPPGRRVRFCPFCGGDQRLRPCPRCDAVLERGWRYCISCGHEIAASR